MNIQLTEPKAQAAFLLSPDSSTFASVRKNLKGDRGTIFYHMKSKLAEVNKMDELEMRTQMELERLENLLIEDTTEILIQCAEAY